MRVGALLLLAAVIVLSMSGTAAAADNTAPMPEAGVDQTVPVNSTVYLDGTASTDPDGEITTVSWTIETPSGGTISPACADCNRTQFNATALGQYTVTLNVTDDDGATRSDTLYVTTVNESGPDVSIAGPTATASGSDATFTANVSAEQAPLQTLTWLVNGSVVERDSLNGSSANSSFTHSFGEAAPVRAVVYDTLGNRGSTTHRVSIRRGGVGSGGSYQCFELCGNGADYSYTQDGVTQVFDTNGMDGIQIWHNGQLTTVDNPTQYSKVTYNPESGYKIDGTVGDIVEENIKETVDSHEREHEPDDTDDIVGKSRSDDDLISDTDDESPGSKLVNDIADNIGISIPDFGNDGGDKENDGGKDDAGEGIGDGAIDDRVQF